MDRSFNRFLVIGSGGREYAIIEALYRTRTKSDNKENNLLVACIGSWVNPGILDLIGEETYYEIDSLKDIERMVQIATELQIELVIIGSEEQLALGIVDEMNKNNIKCFGPTKKMAMIESSKIFMRNLLCSELNNQHAPTWSYLDVNTFDETIIRSELWNILSQYSGSREYVIKADGLKGGKGVKLYGDHLFTMEDSINYCMDLMKMDGKVLIEEKLVGREFSLMTLFDKNRNSAHLPVVQDYKRLYDGDKGPNTGGMGSIVFNTEKDKHLPFLTDDDIKTAKRINEQVFDILLSHYKKEDTTNDEYIGVLYGSFMKTTDNRIMIIEYNSRFGDPESINLMHLLETDLSQILTAMHQGTLNKIDIKFRPEYCVSCYACPLSYPDKQKNDYQFIRFDTSIFSHDCLVYASIIKENPSEDDETDDVYRMLGSRAFAIVVSGDNLPQILSMINKYFYLINGDYHHRSDIGLEYCPSTVNIVAYKDAGVNIDEGNKVVDCIKESVKSTFNENVVKGQYGNFGGSYKMDDEYTLVTSMDGVGTKVQMVLNLLPREEGFESLGYDLFSSNINDILCLGRKVEPMFFLDYFGCQKLNHQDVYHVVKGLSRACRESNCVLIGGETAELKSFSRNWENYRRKKAGMTPLEIEKEMIPVTDNYELVGTIVGKMKESNRFNPGLIKSGDIVVALKSTGLHTNGYSLVNKLITDGKLDGVKWRDVLCATHKNYYKDLEKIWETNIVIKGICHITGGALKHNPCRILPEYVEIKWNQWEIPEIFLEIQRVSNISFDVLFETFNCGVGLILIVESENDYQRLKNIFGDQLMNVGTIVDKN